MLKTSRNSLRRTTQVWKSEGTLGLLTRLQAALRPVISIRKLVLFELDLNEPIQIWKARIPLNVRPATFEDVVRFAKTFQEGGLDEHEVRSRLDRGHSCILGVSDNQLVHFQWIAFSSTYVPEIGMTMLLEPGEAYAYQALTFPAWRGHGIHPAVSSFSDSYKRSRGCTRHYSYVWADNAESLKTHEKLGRKRTRTIWAIRLVGMRKPLPFGATRAGRPSFARQVPEP